MRTFYRVTGFFLIVCFLPFIRSCGDVSMGFPAAAFSGSWVYSLDKVNLTGLLVNICVMILLIVIVIMVLKRWSPGRIVSAGIRGIVIYNVLIIAGYYVTYPLFMLCHNWFMEYVAGIYLYSLYPLHELIEFGFLDRLSESAVIYGDMYDIRFRLHYLLMTLCWFGAGCLAGYIRSRRAAVKLQGQGEM